MKSLLLPLLLGLGTPAATVRVQDELAAKVDAIIEEYDASYRAWYEEYLASSGGNREDLPDPGPAAQRMLKLVEASPSSEAAFNACKWTLASVNDPAIQDPALELLTKHHMARADIEQLALDLRAGTPAANRFLQAAVESVASTESKGRICYSLAQGLARSLEREGLSPGERARIEAAAERHFGRCLTEFADVVVRASPDGDESKDITIGSRAERALFELRTLTPGKTAPEIEGEDVAGVKFKLSDYRGNVVMLDFWGDW